ncbi:MAG: methionine synthase [Acidobacteria bacterium]|nr:MAG: methionine synthase [Acidobacteriota bacterium]
MRPGTKRLKTFQNRLKKEILLLDGGMGTLIQAHQLAEKDYRGSLFTHWKIPLLGNHDLLNLTRPDIIENIHYQYLEAGADIIETNTFNSSSVSQADYQTEDYVKELNLQGAVLARRAADRYEKEHGEPRFVAGVLGPTNRTASLSPDVNDPGYRNVHFDELAATYDIAVSALLDGGADLILVETVFDTLNAKAALFAAQTVLERRKIHVPIMVSGTVTDASGRLLTGQTPEAFWISVKHAKPLSIGLNCAQGAEEMRPYLMEMSRYADCLISAHPNAGLPNEMGGYDETPEHMAKAVSDFARDGLVNIVGGCCGTTPDTIREMKKQLKGLAPRKPPVLPPKTCLSGLEALQIDQQSLFINIGERTNVMGSARFRKLIEKGNYAKALQVARQQVENGAQIIDINMDQGLLDSKKAMLQFLRLLASEPDISRVPLMIDSSRWEVIQLALKNIAGRAIVNSISLKDGEASFLEKALEIRKMGAAVIVMAFDEEGQAETIERKIDIAKRSLRLLTEKAGYSLEDIILDLNVFAVGTGMAEHAAFAVNFIEAARLLRKEYPTVQISGGVSNLSFSFRGHPAIREAMHSVFLYHAIQAGMTMGIVNAGQLAIYEKIEPVLKALTEDVILNKNEKVTDQLLQYASDNPAQKKKTHHKVNPFENMDVEQRLTHALINGLDSQITEDTKEALKQLGSPLAVIDGPLMQGMKKVGEMFGSGQMFLPQVVKSARVMKKAVACLEPYFGDVKGQSRKKGRMILATVKGDVHDIGKSIVSVVLQCNGFEVIDLGVMVPAETILDRAVEEEANLIGLSGLITPSLDEMVHFAREMKRRNLNVPLLIGGATTSTTHTAVKIDAECDAPVFQVMDASTAVTVSQKILSKDKSAAFIEKNKQEMKKRRHTYNNKTPNTIPLEAARANAHTINWDQYLPPEPAFKGTQTINPIPITTLEPFFDWSPFFKTWELRGSFPGILEHPAFGKQARKLWNDAQNMLERVKIEKWIQPKAVFGLFPAESQGDDVVITSHNHQVTFCFTRQQQDKRGRSANRCLADFLAPAGYKDHLGLFAVTTGTGAQLKAREYEKNHDDYNSILIKSLSIVLAEAAAEWLHEKIRTEFWGYAAKESLTQEERIREKYRGIRPAPGYPACPDHDLKDGIWRVLNVEAEIGVQLTETKAMNPPESIAGFYFSHPESSYFGVGTIGKDQEEDLEKRKQRHRQQL